MQGVSLGWFCEPLTDVWHGVHGFSSQKPPGPKSETLNPKLLEEEDSLLVNHYGFMASHLM